MIGTEPRTPISTLQKDRPETQSHTSSLMKEINNLVSPEFGISNLSELFKAEAYMTADIAHMTRQLPKEEKGFREKQIPDFGDDLSQVWMDVAAIAKKAAESGLTGLPNEELSLLAEATATMYCAYVLPKIIVNNVPPENFGIVKVIQEIYQQRDRLQLSDKVFSLLRPWKTAPASIQTDLGFNYQDNPASQTANPEELKRVIKLIGNDEGLALLALTKQSGLQIATGDSRGDNAHGWKIRLLMVDKGILFEGSQDSRSGSTQAADDHDTKKFVYDDDIGDFVADNNEKLLEGRAVKHFPNITDAPRHFADGIIISVSIR